MAESILRVIRETAKGLHRAGTLDTRVLREFDALCLPPVRSYTPAQIKRLRTRNKASQAVFWAYLNTSPSTVRKWEQGQVKRKRPVATVFSLLI
jgi:putative transcriptional regulator